MHHRRWKDSTAVLWRDRPGVVYHWLQATGAPWSATPILDAAGQQCLSVEAVDAAVRSYWVDTVLRQHASVDSSARWTSFMASEFAMFIPQAVWPVPEWSDGRVLMVLRRMREGAAPGLLGLPLVVWKSLPLPFHAAVARFMEKFICEMAWIGFYLVKCHGEGDHGRP